MTYYLCRTDVENPVKGEPKFLCVVGRIIERDGGYVFLPQTSTHKNSRKVWPTMLGCIPKWTDRLGFLELFTSREELEARRALSA